jgi:ribosomal 50S subunit-recycling heat shock protein
LSFCKIIAKNGIIIKKKGFILRIDKFLNTVNIVKRRSLSEDMCKSGVVKINDKVVKPAKDVKVGDIIEIKYLEKVKKIQVLKIPTTKTLPKSLKEEYIKEL